jgi:HEAT repeat protein
MFARLVPIALTGFFALFALGCEKPTHENIEKWAATKKGPGKLKSAFLDDGLDPDVSAHAAVVMIKTGRDNEVKTELEHMNPSRRNAVVTKLAPRLWTMARIEGEMLRPAPPQTAAKDALFLIRKYADPATRTQIDGYLIDWYAVPSYEGRANAGAFPGSTVLRALGPAAAKKMMAVINAIIAAPGQETTKKRVTDELMLGVAVTGDPEAVKYILDIARMDRGDPTLSTRAMGALYRAFVNPEALFEAVEPAALKPNVDLLAKIAQDDAMPAAAANSAVALIRSVGPPDCLPPLLAMVPHPHADSAFRYLAPDHALKCGGVKAIKDVVRAMPAQAYDQKSLAGSVVLAISKLEPRDQVLVELRDLLGDKSRIARWVAIETLAAMKSVEDAPKIASVKGGGEKLEGFWGDGSSKPVPTLGQRAKELATQLGKASK